MTDTAKISRKDLYEKVWSDPIVILAPKYGLSDVGLAKICKKNNIPRPGRGYWARLKSGQNIKRTPLPQSNKDWDIFIRRNVTDAYHSNRKIASHIDPSLKDYLNGITAPNTLDNPHPMIVRSSGILSSCKTDESDLTIPDRGECLDIRVSQASLPRALRIMDCLVKTMAELEIPITLKKESTDIELKGISISISLSITLREILERRRLKARDHNLSGFYQFGYNQYEKRYYPSGNLSLEISKTGYHAHSDYRKTWRDTKTKTLEDWLPSFFLGLFKAASIEKSCKDNLNKEQYTSL